MKKNFMTLCRKWQSLVAILAIAVFSSCSNGAKDEINAMFNNVPADAALVVSGNLEKIVKQSGGNIEDGRISSLGSLPMTNELADLNKVLKNVEATAFVGFMYQNAGYMTCVLKDTDGFKADYAQTTGSEWEKDGEYERNRDCVVVSDRLWVGNRVSVEVVKKFMGLSEAESFLSCEFAEKMSDSDDAIRVWSSIDALTSTMSFSEQAQARMAMSMLFDSPKYFIGEINFDKEGMESEISLVNADYKPAKCVIEMAKIDESVVAGLGGNANAVVAIGISSKLVEKIKELGKSMGGGLPTQMLDVLTPLQGTMAFASPNAGSDINDGFRGIVSTNGKSDAMLAELLGQIGTVKVEGNRINVSKGNYGTGSIDVAKAAEEMNDSWIAMAVHTDAHETGMSSNVFFLLEPSDGSLKLHIKIKYN